MDPARALVIVNPRSGGGLSESRWARVRGALTDGLGELDSVFTTAPRHAADIAAAAAADGRRLIIALGGDGTIHEVAGWIAESLPAPKTGPARSRRRRRRKKPGTGQAQGQAAGQAQVQPQATPAAGDAQVPAPGADGAERPAAPKKRRRRRKKPAEQGSGAANGAAPGGTVPTAGPGAPPATASPDVPAEDAA